MSMEDKRGRIRASASNYQVRVNGINIMHAIIEDERNRERIAAIDRLITADHPFNKAIEIRLAETPKVERRIDPTCDHCCHFQAHPSRCQLFKRKVNQHQYSCKKYSPRYHNR